MTPAERGRRGLCTNLQLRHRAHRLGPVRGESACDSLLGEHLADHTGPGGRPRRAPTTRVPRAARATTGAGTPAGPTRGTEPDHRCPLSDTRSGALRQAWRGRRGRRGPGPPGGRARPGDRWVGACAGGCFAPARSTSRPGLRPAPAGPVAHARFFREAPTLAQPAPGPPGFLGKRAVFLPGLDPVFWGRPPGFLGKREG